MIEIVRAEAAHVDGIVERWIELMDYHAAAILCLRAAKTPTSDSGISRGSHDQTTALVLVALDGRPSSDTLFA